MQYNALAPINIIYVTQLPAKQIFLPEFMVGLHEMTALIAAIAVHAVRINHVLEFLSGFLQRVNKKQSVRWRSM